MNAMIILNKEWKEIVRNRLILFNMVLIPAIFIAMPLVVAFVVSDRPLVGESGQMTTLSEILLPDQDASFQESALLLLHQSLFMFLMVPVFLPLSIAIYSIIGEKDQRSLEPLLGTPIRVRELLLGKCLAISVPTVWVTWIVFAVFLLALYLLVTPALFAQVVSAMTLLTIALLPVLLAALTVMAGLLISTLVDDIRVASQIGGIIVLPLVGLTIFQVASRVAFDLAAFLLTVSGLVAVNLLLFFLLERAFRREAILARWQ